MKNELQSAVDFITDLLAKKTNVKKSEIFRQTLLRVLVSHYQNHWFPEKPFKGSAYRCIRINHKMDPLLRQAGIHCGFSERELFAILPNEFTMWIDPREVSYRIGEEGSIGLVYEGSADDKSDAWIMEDSNLQHNNQNNNLQQQNTTVSPQGSPQRSSPQHQQQPQPAPLQQQQSHPELDHRQNQLIQNQQLQQDFFRSCKDQLRYTLPDSSEPVMAMNLEYLSSFVAS